MAAALSTVLVDYLFVPPKHTLSIGNTEDVVNLLVFFGAAGLVGTLGSLRRNAQLRSQALADELQRANLDLARLNREQAEAAQVAAQLAERDRQVQVLEETDRVRHEFFANVSHELRTPLGGILTGATAVLQRDDLEPSLREELDDVAAAAQRLARLVSDMLDMARIEGGAIDLQLDRLDVADAIEAAVGRLRRANPARDVDVRVAAGTPEVVADWERLGQVIDNLLANADHHAPAGTAITVSAAPEAEGVVVRVVDAGPGVPAELAERIFERFVRGTGGTGLGLPIVRGLITAQGGRVWLETPRSRRGRPLRVLPAAAHDRDGAHPARRGRSVAAPVDRRGRCAAAASAWTPSPTASRRRSGSARTPYDVVLLDIGLPFVDGWQILQEIEGRRQPSVIVISARGEERDKVRALDLGADDYLTKPFGADELLARLRAVLRRVRTAGSAGMVRVGSVIVDLSSRSVTRDADEVRLSPTEWVLLAELASHPGRRSTTGPSSGGCGGRRTSATATTCAPSSSACVASWRTTPPTPVVIVTAGHQGYRFGPAPTARGSLIVR